MSDEEASVPARVLQCLGPHVDAEGAAAGAAHPLHEPADDDRAPRGHVLREELALSRDLLQRGDLGARPALAEAPPVARPRLHVVALEA